MDRDLVLTITYEEALKSRAYHCHFENESFLQLDLMLDHLARDLKVMDASAIRLMRENGIPIVVFSIQKRGGLGEVLAGRGVCTIITD